MRVRFLIDPANLRRWHAEAITAVLAVTGGPGEVEWVDGSKLPAGIDLCLCLERLFFGQSGGASLDRLGVDQLRLPSADKIADLVVDLAGLPSDGRDRLVLTVGGVETVAGAADAIMAGDTPLLDLVAVSTGQERLAGRWRIAVEDDRVLGPGLGFVTGRAVEMLAISAARIAAGATLDDVSLSVTVASAAQFGVRRPLAFLGANFARRLSNRLSRYVKTPSRWSVAWRTDETGDNALPIIAARPWHVLADDGGRFYADPFVWRQDGRAVLFVEEFPYATARGIISALDITTGAPAGRPEPVIETGCHLSYPFVFEDGGVLYMIPETSSRLTVELWRAVDFPMRWEPVATLIAGVDFGDATLHRANGRYYLLGAVRPRGCSSWDGLSVWTAERLLGPWTPLGDGPVKVDVASARPAGRMFEVGGAVIRPFQDSASGYGAGLGFARVDRLDGGGYAETVVDTVRPAPPLAGLHTYNRSGGFEAIDLFGTVKGAVVVP